MCAYFEEYSNLKGLNQTIFVQRIVLFLWSLFFLIHSVRFVIVVVNVVASITVKNLFSILFYMVLIVV